MTPDSIYWLYRPALEKLCRWESLTDGTLDLAKVALMNDLLDVQAENAARARAAAEARRD